MRSHAVRRSSGDWLAYASREAIWIDLSSLRSLGVMAYSDMWGCTTHGRNHRTGIAPYFGFVRGAASDMGSRHFLCVSEVSTTPARRHYDLAPIHRWSQGEGSSLHNAEHASKQNIRPLEFGPMPACVANFRIASLGRIFALDNGDGLGPDCCGSRKEISPSRWRVVRWSGGFSNNSDAHTITPQVE